MRASELHEQARRQHAATLAGLRAERELYQRLGEELATLADPAAPDLEITTVQTVLGVERSLLKAERARARRAEDERGAAREKVG